MKRIFTIAALLIGGSTYAQTDNVGIGTSQPDNSAILDLSSSNKGFLLPRMSETQRLEIKSPAQGLQVFQTDAKSGLYIFDGSAWSVATSANSTAAALDPWLEGGNDITTNTGAFIGTKSNHGILFKMNNYRAGYLHNSGLVFFGAGAGNSNTATINIGLGAFSLYQNTTGTGNIGIGHGAMNNTTTGSSGNYNVALGFSALQNNRGDENVAIGKGSLQSNTTGRYNVGLGTNTLTKTTGGEYNMAIGAYALLENLTGSNNMAIGADALRFNTGSFNSALGTGAGRNSSGDRNIFIGFGSGRYEAGNDKLYIANSSTTTPLIYGDFSAKYVTIGDVAVDKRAAAGGGGYNLLVKGGILTEKVKVALASSADWADYVFEESYKLMSLKNVEDFVKMNKHLPNVPSADEMALKGMDVAQTSKMFMEKIEELTLYIIELNKEIETLKKLR
jgi:hypothetical protein